MILFLCSPNDVSARNFVAALHHHYNVKAQIITAQELIYAPAMEHSLNGQDFISSVTLKTHGTLDSDSITSVVNRLEWLPDAHLARANATDRSYIQQELQAIWSSWISALPCPVINRPTAISMSGPTFHPAVWQHYAALAGLPTADMIYDSEQPEPVATVTMHSVIVCQDQCHSTSLSPELFDACLNLAEYTGFDMLELLFGQQPDGTVVFSYASPIPDLSRAGNRLIAQMAHILQGETL